MANDGARATGWRLVLVASAGIVALDLLNLLVARAVFIGSANASGFFARASVLAVLLFMYHRSRANRDFFHLVLGALLFASLYQFRFAEGRRAGDGFFYYAYVQSLWKDGDLDFANEYEQYGIADYPSVSVPTSTGKRPNNFSVGPALLWSPFFVVGEIYARTLARGDPSVDLTGSGPIHQRAVALATLLYGFAAVVLVYSLLKRYFRPESAFAGSALMWLATPLHWYMLYQPTMSHALSTFMAAWFVWYWDHSRTTLAPSRALVLGLIGGLTVVVRWQNALIFLLPAYDLARLAAPGLRERDMRRVVVTTMVPGMWLTAGALITVLPQLIAWRSIFGVFLLSDPPQGPNYLRLLRPFAWETLFSSRHGLLSWTPVTWLGFVGFLPLLRRRLPNAEALPAGALFTVLAIMTYVNMCVGDWWGGGSFGARRFDAALPFFAFGIAASFVVLRDLVRRYPGPVVTLALVGLVSWNLLLTEQYRRFWIPPDDTVSFPEVVHGQARLVSEKLGSPWSWPANWLFALRYQTRAEKYDLLVGRYLFYRNNNLGGLIDLGEDDGAFIGDGWRRPEQREGTWVRQIRGGEARLFVPLESAQPLGVTLHVSSRPDPFAVHVEINGREVARFLAEPGLTPHAFEVREELLRPGINFLDIRLDKASDDAFLLVDRVQFERRIDSPGR